MICIKCSHDTKVTNSRPHKKTPSVWRRRQCLSCGATFTTNEVVADDSYLFYVLSGDRKEAFSLPRLMFSIGQALSHRHDIADDAYWLAQTVAQSVQATASDTVEVRSLAETTWQTLAQFDATAGISYGARHGLLKNTAQKPRRGRPRTTRRMN